MSHEIQIPSHVTGAPDTITVELTLEHIRRGERCAQRLCPFALAFHAIGYHGVRVRVGEVILEFEDKIYYYNVPDPISRMIVSFDAGYQHVMRPGKFTFKRISNPRFTLVDPKPESWDAVDE